jgi:hypothetical protein
MTHARRRLAAYLCRQLTSTTCGATRNLATKAGGLPSVASKASSPSWLPGHPAGRSHSPPWPGWRAALGRRTFRVKSIAMMTSTTMTRIGLRSAMASCTRHRSSRWESRRLISRYQGFFRTKTRRLICTEICLTANPTCCSSGTRRTLRTCAPRRLLRSTTGCTSLRPLDARWSRLPRIHPRCTVPGVRRRGRPGDSARWTFRFCPT